MWERRTEREIGAVKARARTLMRAAKIEEVQYAAEKRFREQLPLEWQEEDMVQAGKTVGYTYGTSYALWPSGYEYWEQGLRADSGHWIWCGG